MPIETLDFLSKGGVVVILLAGIWWFAKNNSTVIEKQEKATNDKISYILENQKLQRETHIKEEEALKNEIKAIAQERKEERKEWLDALGNNTEQLKNVAEKLQIIPNLQKDLDYIKMDITSIKKKMEE